MIDFARCSRVCAARLSPVLRAFLPLVSRAFAILTASGVALIIGRLCSGWIIDRVFAPYVAMVFMLVPMFGIAVLGFGFGGISPVIGTICLGMGIGAEIDIMAFLVGRYFGLRQYGTLYGVMFAIAILGNATGSNLLGWSFQFFNSYTPALVLFEVFLVAAALCFLGLGPYRYAAPARDIEVDTPQIKPSAA